VTAKAKKCEFGASECVYLGHIVGSGSVKPEKDKPAAIQAFQTPQTKKDVRSFFWESLATTAALLQIIQILQPLLLILLRRVPQQGVLDPIM